MSSASTAARGRAAGRRGRAAVAIATVLCAATATGASAGATGASAVRARATGASAVRAGAAGPIEARSATVLNVKDEGSLHFVKSSGSTLIDEGHATGTIPGNVRIRFTYNGEPHVSAQLTIYGAHGTIEVRASGALSSPTSPTPSFSGTLTIAGGSGRYSRARGGGRLYGVFHRRGYAMVVQTQGTLRY